MFGGGGLVWLEGRRGGGGRRLAEFSGGEKGGRGRGEKGNGGRRSLKQLVEEEEGRASSRRKHGLRFARKLKPVPGPPFLPPLPSYVDSSSSAVTTSAASAPVFVLPRNSPSAVFLLHTYLVVVVSSALN